MQRKDHFILSRMNRLQRIVFVLPAQVSGELNQSVGPSGAKCYVLLLALLWQKQYDRLMFFSEQQLSRAM